MRQSIRSLMQYLYDRRRLPWLRRWRFFGAEILAAFRRRLWSLTGAQFRLAATDRRLNLGDDFWLFILGVDNSGTTLLAHILDSHPRIRVLPDEGQNLTVAFPLRWDYSIARLWTKRIEVLRFAEHQEAQRAIQARFDWSFLYPPGPGILLEKSPPNTVRSLWLQRHFVPSRFVAIIRSPYAVAEGIHRREGHSIEEAALHWRIANECMLVDSEKLAYFHLLRYEDLCQQPDQELEKLERFLGLTEPIDRNILQHPLKAHNRDGYPQKLRNFNPASLTSLSTEDIRTVTRVTAALAKKLGYQVPDKDHEVHVGEP